ncbi:MAG: CpsD/CapB family tyrosine-protein kinase [Arenibacterium sp.]
MKDDKPGGGFSEEGRERKRTLRPEEMRGGRPNGLFGHPTPSRPSGFEEGGARLRLVQDRPVASGKPTRPRLSADIWEDLRRVAPGPLAEGSLDLETMCENAVADSFDKLRTILLRELRSNGWTRIAVVAPTRGCGASFSAANLALSFSRIPGNRTVLMDLNFRRPGLATLFDVETDCDMSGFLAGRVHLRDQIVCASENLAIGFTPAPDPRAAHLLHSDCGAVVVSDLVDQLNPEVLICDLPPMLESDDLAGFLPQIDGVLLVADAVQTLPDHITECEKRLSGQTRVLGVVLNQTRRSGPAPSYA